MAAARGLLRSYLSNESASKNAMHEWQHCSNGAQTLWVETMILESAVGASRWLLASARFLYVLKRRVVPTFGPSHCNKARRNDGGGKRPFLHPKSQPENTGRDSEQTSRPGFSGRDSELEFAAKIFA